MVGQAAKKEKTDEVKQALKYIEELHRVSRLGTCSSLLLARVALMCVVWRLGEQACGALTALVEAINGLRREIRSLEDQVKVEKGKAMAENLARVTQDREAVRQENALLKAQRKAAAD